MAFSHTYVAIVKRKCERDSTNKRRALDAYDDDDDEDYNLSENQNYTAEKRQRHEMKWNRGRGKKENAKKVENVMEQQNAENCV